MAEVQYRDGEYWEIRRTKLTPDEVERRLNVVVPAESERQGAWMQPAIIAFVERHDETTIREIGDALDRTSSQINPTLSKMVNEGTLRRVRPGVYALRRRHR